MAGHLDASSSRHVVIVDADVTFARAMKRAFERRGWRVTTLKALPPLGIVANLWVVDRFKLSGPINTALVSLIETARPATVILTTPFSRPDEAAQASRAGVGDCLTKPLTIDRLLEASERAMRRDQVEVVSHSLTEAHIDEGQTTIAGLMRQAGVVAASRATVMLVGDSGTGKSRLARWIHDHSPRRDRPFVEVSCASLPDTLLDSELFGHVAGAFTDAHTDRRGRFASADGGTLLLDDIDSASPALQVKLLRVLQEQTIEPVGADEAQRVDVRVIVASRVELEGLVRQGRFREDLHYRVNVVPLWLPALKERRADIPALARAMLRIRRAESHCRASDISDEAMDALQRYDWPGNLRELEHAIERATVLCERPTIRLADLPDAVKASGTAAGSRGTLAEALVSPERHILEAALIRNGWNRTATAADLGIERTTLYKKMRKHGLAIKRRAA
jgi:DNA-binding NtrC family response regulator